MISEEDRITIRELRKKRVAVNTLMEQYKLTYPEIMKILHPPAEQDYLIAYTAPNDRILTCNLKSLSKREVMSMFEEQHSGCTIIAITNLSKR